jgi:C-terminal processing protease CtpA/Prc
MTTMIIIIIIKIDTLADKAGLKRGDLVVEINETATENLNNEQLRKLMRQRLQMNEIRLRVLCLEKQEKCKFI